MLDVNDNLYIAIDTYDICRGLGCMNVGDVGHKLVSTM